MKIGIIGTRGIPNQYGGFEQFAETFSTRMVEKGHEVTVYNSHRHPYQQKSYKDVQIVSCYDPEFLLGTAGQFIYDLNCIRDSRKQNFDVILQLGYTSSTIWSWLYPKSSILVTNMDGLEWSRAKYNKAIQYFLTYAEKWGVRNSDHLIADSKGIQEYLRDKYNADAELIPYGADIYESTDDDYSVLAEFSVQPNGYDLLIARFEPENNIETTLKAYTAVPGRKIVLIGNHNDTSFGRRLYKEYGMNPDVVFSGSIFDPMQLNALRYHSRLYIHGHSVGGTNPSLLEAMGCNALICAHENQFNKHVLGKDAYYFKNSKDLVSIISAPYVKKEQEKWLFNNRLKIANEYNWDRITEKIETCFNQWKYGEKYRQVLYTV
ncbi:MAG: DUF1972 domain-containing protein [Flavipsychrobacter sp.]|nr:DUF1972 domain-containing protein [Flavipsychrobacter sp.]